MTIKTFAVFFQGPFFPSHWRPCLSFILHPPGKSENGCEGEQGREAKERSVNKSDLRPARKPWGTGSWSRAEWGSPGCLGRGSRISALTHVPPIITGNQPQTWSPRALFGQREQDVGSDTHPSNNNGESAANLVTQRLHAASPSSFFHRVENFRT